MITKTSRTSQVANRVAEDLFLFGDFPARLRKQVCLMGILRCCFRGKALLLGAARTLGPTPWLKNFNFCEQTDSKSLLELRIRHRTRATRAGRPVLLLLEVARGLKVLFQHFSLPAPEWCCTGTIIRRRIGHWRPHLIPKERSSSHWISSMRQRRCTRSGSSGDTCRVPSCEAQES